MRARYPWKLTALALGLLLLVSMSMHLRSCLLSLPLPATCGVKGHSSAEFRSLCEQVLEGQDLIDVLAVLGAPLGKECRGGSCRVTIEGGDDFFCDSCTVEFSAEDYRVVGASWLYGDQ